MKKKFERIGGKILLGYAVIIVIAICSLSYIYSMIERVVSDGDVNTVGRQKIYLVTNTQSLLYESEALGQLIDMPEDDYTYFHETLDKAVQNMEDLRLLVTDTLFQHKIDTITALIEQKRKNTNDLLQIWNEANADLYEKNIQKALQTSKPDVKETEIQERSNVQTETIIVPAQRRSFLRRLAEVFVPSDRDSSIVVSANQEVLKDSTVNVYNPNEAISSTLRNIQSNVATERQRLR
jgi:CHASE3 domain sensor protein